MKHRITKGILRPIRQCDNLKRTSLLHPHIIEYRTQFIVYRKILTRLSKYACANYFKNHFAVHSRDPKLTWQTSKKCTNENDVNSSNYLCTKGENGDNYNDIASIVKEFNRYFSTVGSKVAARQLSY